MESIECQRAEEKEKPSDTYIKSVCLFFFPSKFKKELFLMFKKDGGIDESENDVDVQPAIDVCGVNKGLLRRRQRHPSRHKRKCRRQCLAPKKIICFSVNLALIKSYEICLNKNLYFNTKRSHLLNSST